MHQSVKAGLSSFLTQYEGKANFMYLDVKGLVTTGIGHLIDPVNRAMSLEFGTAGGGVADAGTVAKEWTTVKGRIDLIHRGAAAFAGITNLRLTELGIQNMVLSHAAGIVNYITTNASARTFYSNFENWPADAQLGFLGVAWGGIPIPQFGWHKFPLACRDEDWDKAASECYIKSPLAAGRNEAHRLMFRNAAAVKANNDNIADLEWPSRRGRSVTG